MPVFASPVAAQWGPNGVLLTARPAHPSGIRPLGDGMGGLYALTGDFRNESLTGGDCYLQHLDADGLRYPGWAASGIPVSVAPGNQAGIALVLDPLGGALVSIADNRTGGGGTGADVYAQRVNADGTLPVGWAPNGMPVCLDPGYQAVSWNYYPGIASDGSGGVYLAWDDHRDDPIGFYADLYVQRLLADGTVAPGWPLDGRKAYLSSTGGGVGPILPDEEGGIVAIFGDDRRGVPEPYDVDIYAQRIRANGQNAPGWPADGKLLVSGFAAHRGTVPDDAGGFFVVRAKITEQTAPYESEIWVHRFTFDGERAPGWPEGGVLVCGGPGERYDIHVERDAMGGVVFAWWEFQPGSAAEIYVSRVRPDGTLPPGWPANGLRVSNPVSQPYFDFDPVVTFDGAGGLYVAWCRDYNTISPSYIQHITAVGAVAPGWPSYGFLVAATPEQSKPEIVTDGRGGAIVTWAQPDGYYAARFAADGPVAVSMTLARSEAAPDRVTLEWHTAEPASFAATLERSEGRGEWRALATLSPDGEGALRYDDREVAPGRRYGYRLAWTENGAPRTSAEAWLETPLALQLALQGFTPNPSPASATVAFTLPEAGPARLELLDVAGRRVASHDVGSRGAGRHALRLDEHGPLAPGLYLLRLTTPARTLTARGVVVR
jgi:hypothetical protein